MEAIINTASTGYSSHRPIRLRMWRRTRRNIQTTSPNRTGGQTQLNPACTAADPLRDARPAAPMNAAGTAAHRCGWSLNRVDSAANNAHPRANANSTTPVMTFSSAGTNGAATRTTATISPAAIDAATINPILLLAVRFKRPDWMSLSEVVVIMMASSLKIITAYAPLSPGSVLGLRALPRRAIVAIKKPAAMTGSIGSSAVAPGTSAATRNGSAMRYR